MMSAFMHLTADACKGGSRYAVFTLEVVDPAYDMEETGEDGTPAAGLPMAAIIGISVGGGVLLLAGAFCIVWFVVLKKGKKPEAKAAE